MKKGGQGDLSQSNSWRKLLFVVLIVAILGVAYFIYSYWGSSPEEESFSFLDSCLNSCGECEQGCYDMDYVERSRSEGDESLCDKIKNENLKNECINSFILTKAIIEKDSSLCEEIVDEIEKEICINIVNENPPEEEEFLE